MDKIDILLKELEEMRQMLYELRSQVDAMQKEINWLMKNKQPREVVYGRQ